MQPFQAKNQDDFWSWAKSGMGNGLRALNYYNDEQPLFLRGYINDKQSRIMGYATMRQLRVTRGNYHFHQTFLNSFGLIFISDSNSKNIFYCNIPLGC